MELNCTIAGAKRSKKLNNLKGEHIQSERAMVAGLAKIMSQAGYVMLTNLEGGSQIHYARWPTPWRVRHAEQAIAQRDPALHRRLTVNGGKLCCGPSPHGSVTRAQWSAPLLVAGLAATNQYRSGVVHR